jgi:hypothetical protein
MTMKTLSLARNFVKGLLINNVPNIAKGAIAEWLRTTKVDFPAVTKAIQQNTRVWPLIPERYHAGIRNIARDVGDLDWLTADWLIDIARKENPPMASLFLGWRKAYNWLNRQIVDCKSEIEKLKTKS